MAADFGLAGYADGQLAEIFGLLRGLRLSAGDFTADTPAAAPGTPAAAPGTPAAAPGTPAAPEAATRS
jgi:hypothetical protein